MRKLRLGRILGAALLTGALCAQADVTLPKIFSSNMVLQRDQPITVWGWADAGEKVTVTLGDKSAATVADKSGKWEVTLPQRSLGKPLTMTVKGNNEIKLNNILMGDVWLCSGQSNMEFGIKNSTNAKQAIAAANRPNLRLFFIQKRALKKPAEKLGKTSGWDVCTPQTVVKDGTWGGFSAVAYYFGSYLQKQIPEVPIGLIHSSWGGSKIETWTTYPGWKSVPQLADEYKKVKSTDLKKLKKVGNHSKIPALYNGMVNPFTKLRIKGAIWYQGEANRKEGADYFYRMQALINGWRSIWGKDMPFYFVQLAPFSYAADLKGKNGKEWLPEVCTAQAKAAAEIPHTGMAVTIDIGNVNDIHPKNKDDVGKRLALLALKDTYGKNVVADSPAFDSAKLKDGKVIVKFKHVGGGLQTSDGKAAVPGFEVAGKDGVFHKADAVISGKETVTLSCKEVKKPAKVRYAWSNTPKVTLQNKEGLPIGWFSFAL